MRDGIPKEIMQEWDKKTVSVYIVSWTWTCNVGKEGQWRKPLIKRFYCNYVRSILFLFSFYQSVCGTNAFQGLLRIFLKRTCTVSYEKSRVDKVVYF